MSLVHGLLRPPRFRDRWTLAIQSTGRLYESGSFELLVNGTSVTVDWDEGSQDLKDKIEAATDLVGVTCIGGPLNRREIGINHPGILNLDTGFNNLLSGRPYLQLNFYAGNDSDA